MACKMIKNSHWDNGWVPAGCPADSPQVPCLPACSSSADIAAEGTQSQGSAQGLRGPCCGRAGEDSGRVKFIFPTLQRLTGPSTRGICGPSAWQGHLCLTHFLQVLELHWGLAICFTPGACFPEGCRRHGLSPSSAVGGAIRRGGWWRPARDQVQVSGSCAEGSNCSHGPAELALLCPCHRGGN